MKIPTLNHSTKQAISKFYKDNNFAEDGGINEKYSWIKFGFFSVPIPNLESRSNSIMFHDVNHIVTGFDTNWKGESAVLAWEIAPTNHNSPFTVFCVPQNILFLFRIWAVFIRSGNTFCKQHP